MNGNGKDLIDFTGRVGVGELPPMRVANTVGGCIGQDALTEIRRFQMAVMPPSTFNSTPFTKLESSEARKSATDAISSG